MQTRSRAPLAPPPEAPPQAAPTEARADAALFEYVGYLAGWFDIGQIAAGRRLRRAGVREALLNDL